MTTKRIIEKLRPVEIWDNWEEELSADSLIYMLQCWGCRNIPKKGKLSEEFYRKLLVKRVALEKSRLDSHLGLDKKMPCKALRGLDKNLPCKELRETGRRVKEAAL